MRSGIFGDRVGWRRWRLRNGHHAYSPGSVDDSLIVGSSRMERGAAAENTRMFFDKATGAFRAGTAASTEWDSGNLGASSVAAGASPKASAVDSVAIGNGAIASGQSAIAIGTNATSSGIESVAIAASGGYFAGTTATQNGAISIGHSCAANSQFAVAIGDSVTVSGSLNTSASAGIGQSVSVTGAGALGTGSWSLSSRWGQHAHAAGPFLAVGDAQRSLFVMRNSTTNATATELGLDGASAYLTIGATRTMSFHIKIAAHRTDVSGTAAAWPLITGGITRDASGNCRLLGSVTGASTTSLCDAGASTWSVAVTADSTNNRLAITVTGEAAKTIRWVASVEMAEVG